MYLYLSSSFASLNSHVITVSMLYDSDDVNELIVSSSSFDR